ncbi:MAG: F0F1 ATP synthase subunit delta [Micrococcales bacterium]|nr:F0F1 ATP synthase subunit delta [Micrococcales bacterium]
MRGASGASLAQVERLLADRFASPTAAATVSAELFSLVDALDSSPALLRVLANPNNTSEAKATLIARIMAAHDDGSVAFAQEVAAARWSHDEDLADAVEILAIGAQLTVIEAEPGGLEAFESTVFGFDRLCLTNRDVRLALADPDATQAAREKLFGAIVGESLPPGGLALLKRMTMAGRGRSLPSALLLLSEVSASRRGRLVATVTSGAELSPAQRDRITRLLEAAYGRGIHLNASHDPAVVGGLRIHVGDDVVDATVLARLSAMERAVRV